MVKNYKVTLKWVERFLHILVPLSAGVAAIFPQILGTPFTTESLIRLILGLVAGIAVSGTLERYVTLNEIEEHTRKLSERSNIELIRSAQESGVDDLFPRANEERLRSIVGAIKHASGDLDICGIALPAMVKNDIFREAVSDYSKRHEIRVMLLDPDCDEAKRRANIEAPLGRATITDIKDTRDWILKQQTENGRFRLHLYQIPPMLSLIVTNQHVFVEPYHFGRPEGLEGCIGGNVPMMKIRNLPELEYRNPYAFFKAHFEYLWNFTRGLRVNLPLEIIDARPSHYVVLENKMKNIQMAGWELSGQDSQRPYQFEPGLIWERGQRILIAQDTNALPHADKVLKTNYDFLGNNSILRLVTGSGILVSEWSIPQYIEAL